MKEILQHIEEIRKQKGLKQSALAEMLGVKQNTYSQYITRNEDIKYSLLSQIADKLGYKTVQHLSQQFKKITGFSPSQFQELKEKKRLPIDFI